jgi:hypothetical protein
LLKGPRLKESGYMKHCVKQKPLEKMLKIH